eukprot:TRINITY_DN874_c0_g1_i1.p2 TRINITY_DN874_c0_g1~~TRINITY_DN874_c0_g1_i1.p2  ORF type:complete len:171 (+),score=17.40 TRINITY_DN874_c0_g1_i1:699-1211(+)
MRTLDEKTNSVTKEVETFLKQQQKRKSQDTNTSEKTQELRSKLMECIKCSEEKIKIAVQAYDVLDKHIRRLDKDLEKFQLELDKEDKHKEQLNKASGTNKTVASVKVTDLDVDPNEPLYCTCRRVSFGQMIGCDNKDCPIEWFHFECVGIKESNTKGKWYCDICKNKNNN